MEMLKEYLEELHDGKSCVWDETGFLTYWIRETEVGKEAYIEDIYTKPEYRKSQKASKLANKVLKIAKENNCDFLTGSVVPSANKSDVSVKVLQGYGFKLWCCEQNIIWFKKEINNV